MSETAPPLGEFDRTCRDAFRFLVEEFGFDQVPCLAAHQRFCARFVKEHRSLEILGEGYGTVAACHVSDGDNGPVSLIFLVPEASRPKRSRKRDRMGQLDQIREWAQLARDHAADFFAGDSSRFDRAWDAWKKLQRTLRS